jgi:hypothetical protein
MSDSLDLEAAALQAREARARLAETANELQSRLAPARLLDDAVENVRTGATGLAHTTADAARRRPGAAAAAAALGVALIAHRPLWRLARRITGRRRPETD